MTLAEEIVNNVILGLSNDPVGTIFKLAQAEKELQGAFKLIIDAVQQVLPDLIKKTQDTLSLTEDEDALNAAKMLASVVAVQSAKLGSKLNYIRLLLGMCPEGYQMMYFRSGGRVCSECVKNEKHLSKEIDKPINDPIKAFKAKCGKKLKVKKCQGGDRMNKIYKNIEDNKASLNDHFSRNLEAKQAGATADKLKNKYPDLTHDQRAGRDPIIKNGKRFFMNGEGRLIEVRNDIPTPKGHRLYTKNEVEREKKNASKYEKADTEKCGGKLKKKKG